MMWSPWERMETMVKAHHNIKQATRIELKTSHLADRTSEYSSEPPAPDCDRDPWHPFRTLIDYEISKFAMGVGI